ncbi:hypothetical protein PISMIDRAFT_679927 [Pisolithus microcarpus 441]|uniref:Uncharacterized protein n=1 Tax=Pisolithus microcarpus 441 TaxID=765257 RepID=A0A0C9YD15_9AGAM|nr:hypothetical protein PISMIDRAFT_679927 [Pisolithus microcarpus 441]
MSERPHKVRMSEGAESSGLPKEVRPWMVGYRFPDLKKTGALFTAIAIRRAIPRGDDRTMKGYSMVRGG